MKQTPLKPTTYLKNTIHRKYLTHTKRIYYINVSKLLKCQPALLKSPIGLFTVFKVILKSPTGPTGKKQCK